MTYDVGNLGPVLEQAQKCGRVIPVNRIPTITLNWIFKDNIDINTHQKPASFLFTYSKDLSIFCMFLYHDHLISFQIKKKMNWESLLTGNHSSNIYRSVHVHFQWHEINICTGQRRFLNMIFWTENTEQNNTNKKINAKFKIVNLIFFPAINILPQLNSFLSNWKGWIIFINLFARICMWA